MKVNSQEYTIVKDEFNYSDIVNNFAVEHYKYFGRPVPREIKKRLFSKKFKKKFVGDDHFWFELLCPKEFRNKKFICPKCKKESYFYSARYKKIDKMLKTQKFVRCEQNRTFTCESCSFTFHPLANTAYRNMKIDLRLVILFMFISDDGKIKFPVSAYARILGVSFGTAKRLVDLQKNGKSFSEKEVNQVIDKGENYWKVKILVQLADERYGK